MQLDNIKIILVGTTHPGNIGAAARAMKTMGLRRLRLVSPKHFPDADATARASGADDILDSAEVYDKLGEAVADCIAVVGTTARTRTLGAPVLNPNESAGRIIATQKDGPLAMVFGRERAGLSNEELDYCQWLVNIPANPAYSSLNLAMAVQLVAYEIRMAATGGAVADKSRALAPAIEMERLFHHIKEISLETGFLDPNNPRYLMRRIRLLINRAGPDQNEVNILRGFLSAIEKYNKKYNKRHE